MASMGQQPAAASATVTYTFDYDGFRRAPADVALSGEVPPPVDDAAPWFGLTPGEHPLVEEALRYNDCRCYDPSPGRWLSNEAAH